jgi:phospholipase/carboxylesterase
MSNDNGMMKRHDLSLVYNVREPEEHAAGERPLLLLLHGIGSNEDDLFALASYLDPSLLVVSARAPISLPQGGYGWFNIEYTSRGLQADLEQAETSRKLILAFLDELIGSYAVDPGRVMLMGFSQGAMMSLGLLLTEPQRVSAVAALSARFPSGFNGTFGNTALLRNKPVLVTHGIYDPVIPIEYGRECRDELQRLSIDLTYREYPMAHEVTMEALRDVSTWITTNRSRTVADPDHRSALE